MKTVFSYIRNHRKFVLILAGIIVLNLIFGFDARFTIINLMWIFINLNLTKPEDVS